MPGLQNLSRAWCEMQRTIRQGRRGYFYYTGTAMIIWWPCQAFFWALIVCNCSTPFLIKPRQRKALIQTRVKCRRFGSIPKSYRSALGPIYPDVCLSKTLLGLTFHILGALCSPIDSIAVSLSTNSCHSPSESWLGRSTHQLRNSGHKRCQRIKQRMGIKKGKLQFQVF